MGRKRVIINRLCVICKSQTTYIHPTLDYPLWHFGPNKETLCHRCWNRDVNAKRRIRFRGIRISIKWLKRTYQCTICNKKGITAFHHWFYLTICPWFGIQEICWDCHTNITISMPHKKGGRPRKTTPH